MTTSRNLALIGLLVFGMSLVPLRGQTGGENTGVVSLATRVEASTSTWEVTVEGQANSAGTLYVAILQSAPGSQLIVTSIPVTLGANGKASLGLPFDALVTAFGPFTLGMTFEATNALTQQTELSMLHILRCCEIPIATFGLYSPPHGNWWMQVPEGGSQAYMASIATYTTGALPDQYVFYAAPMVLWQTCPGIEGLLPVN